MSSKEWLNGKGGNFASLASSNQCAWPVHCQSEKYGVEQVHVLLRPGLASLGVRVALGGPVVRFSRVFRAAIMRSDVRAILLGVSGHMLTAVLRAGSGYGFTWVVPSVGMATAMTTAAMASIAMSAARKGWEGERQG
jgi:hypothetical protein